MKMFSGAMLQWAYDFECRNSTAVNNLKRSAGASFVALLGQGHRSGWPYDGDLDERLSNDSTEHEKKIFFYKNPSKFIVPSDFQTTSKILLR